MKCLMYDIYSSFLFGVVAGILTAVAVITFWPEPVQIYPPAGPSEIFGQTLVPEPEPCPACENCESGTWLAQFMHYLDEQARSPREIRDVLRNCWWETRYNHEKVSDTDDWGICGINRTANPDVDVERLLIDPDYAAIVCLDKYRVFYHRCGKNWRCCYRRGVKGCKAAIDAARGKR